MEKSLLSRLLGRPALVPRSDFRGMARPEQQFGWPLKESSARASCLRGEAGSVAPALQYDASTQVLSGPRGGARFVSKRPSADRGALFCIR